MLMESGPVRSASTLGHTVAYADSTSDLPDARGRGLSLVAVNPEPKLAAIARRRGWPIEHWERAPGGPRAPSRSRPAVLGASRPMSGRLTTTTAGSRS